LDGRALTNSSVLFSDATGRSRVRLGTVIGVPRFGAFLLLLPLACFSEADVDASGGETTNGGTSTTATSASTTTSATTDTSATSTTTSASTDPDTGDATSSTSTSVDSTETAQSESGTDTGEACDPGFVEIPMIPLGWDGVFVLSPPALGDGGLPMCPPMLVDHDAVIADASVADTCACTCDPGCFVFADLDADCTSFDDILPGLDGICVDSVMGTAHVSLSSGLADEDICATPTSVPVIDGSRHRVCEDTDGSPCVPAPDDFLAPCVRHDGDVPCPGGPYSAKVTTVETIDVFCNPCESCVGAADTACATSTLTLYPELDCMGMGAAVTDNACSPESGVSMIADFDLACPPAPAEGGSAGGERTYCCVP
jgi:hypothetical protein